MISIISMFDEMPRAPGVRLTRLLASRAGIEARFLTTTHTIPGRTVFLMRSAMTMEPPWALLRVTILRRQVRYTPSRWPLSFTLLALDRWQALLYIRWYLVAEQTGPCFRDPLLAGEGGDPTVLVRRGSATCPRSPQFRHRVERLDGVLGDGAAVGPPPGLLTRLASRTRLVGHGAVPSKTARAWREGPCEACARDSLR